ncbi:PepSY-like domain-containing protein [Dysgonomonas sp. Marseille-P4677]|uniref:PepSY-like domain-containing protein n=1 Tax=Dysgonomonas sp. Marseille-P4677 TaxID=2364790 RepID=UPI001912AFB8|nr:PepSY-like domain-containing protein [Dysgonomonas sp. Marseille-P4677]MBK5720278.1 PepSY-like domain-containing protein [Dysgonomonas sp. Marseille-P4677]
MKTVQLFFTVLFLAGSLNFVACSSDNNDNGDGTETIAYNQLPAISQTFITDHFNGYEVTKALKAISGYDVSLAKSATAKSTYTTTYASGYEIKFDQNGVWYDIEANNDGALPDNVLALVPRSVVSYVVQYYPAKSITEIKKTTAGYEVDLTGNTDIELHFDVNGNYVGTDHDDHDVDVPVSNLPTISQTFLITHFTGVDVAMVKKDNDSYDVTLANSLEIDFTLQGEWKDIDANKATIPTSVLVLLPQSINDYIQANHASRKVESMEKKVSTYEIDLSGNVDLVFDLQGNLWSEDRGDNNSNHDNDRVSVDVLPTAARTILNTYFLQSVTILYVEKDDNKFEVKLSDGTEVDFSAGGELLSVEVLPSKSVPDAIIPSKILSYVKANYSTRLIEEFEKKYSGYKIELSGYPEIELIFDLNGNFKGFDK